MAGGGSYTPLEDGIPLSNPPPSTSTPTSTSPTPTSSTGTNWFSRKIARAKAGFFSGLEDTSARGRRVYTLNLVGFFMCGLVNNFGYVVMLSAAVHLLESSPDFPKSAVLLADILPTFILKLTAPFFMHRLPYVFRVWVVALFGIAAFLMTGLLDSLWLRLAGVICASISAGFGEVTFLAMSSFYHPNTVSAWSSGTGGAGLFGSLLYLAMTSWIGLSPSFTLLVSSVFPFGVLIAFYGLLRKPFQDSTVVVTSLSEADVRVITPLPSSTSSSRGDSSSTIPPDDAPLLVRSSGTAARRPDGSLEPDPEPGSLEGAKPAQLSLAVRVSLLVPLLKYILPLFLVYYAEYTINQAVSPTITFSEPYDDPDDYYPTYAALYQAGVFVSRSSVNIFPITRIWVPAVLQFVNLVFLWSHAYFLYLPSAYIVFVVIFWEGLLGGATYVNAFARITAEVEPSFREFSLGVTSVGDSAGIVCAALTGFWMEPWLKRRQRSLANRGIHPARRFF